MVDESKLFKKAVFGDIACYMGNIIAKECKTKTGTKFTAYKLISFGQGGLLVDLKFTRDIADLPEKDGLYTIYIDADAVNRDNKRLYPCYWVNDLIGWQEKKPDTSNRVDLSQSE